MLEPGRLIVGNAGILRLAGDLSSSEGEGRTFIIVDAAMNDLIRPTLYDAWHDILPVGAGAGLPRARPTWSARSANPATPSRRTGPCRRSPPAICIAVMTAGAYGAVQSGDLQFAAAGAEVLVKGDRVRHRQAAPDL